MHADKAETLGEEVLRYVDKLGEGVSRDGL
jgi:hypothetical protein